MKTIFFLMILICSVPLHAKSIVFWLSIDGFKPSYLEKAKTPNIQRLLNHSIYSKRLSPIFPSITFPSHCSQATGVKVKEHGIPFNTFYDTSTDKIESYPGDSKLLEAEPIWQTVKKGGLRSAVHNWPLSFRQSGKDKADYFNETYDNELSDEQKIDKILNLWQKDSDSGKELNLIMAYIVGPDSAGHKFGPNDERVFKVVENVDELIGKIEKRIRQMGEATKEKGNQYFLLITTDHGMSELKTGVNLTKLSNVPDDSAIKFVPGGNIGHVFLNKIPQKDRQKTITQLLNEYKKHPFVKAYEKKNLPREWNYGHAKRVGDLVVVLSPQYAFVNDVPGVTAPVSEIGGPLGMHGYDPKDVSEMYGLMFLWRYPEIPKSIEIKSPVDSLQLHPTVAFLLNISPSPKARARPIDEVIPVK